MTTTANGRAERKSLAGQLDRLDAILDGLADGLNEAVAAAVKVAVTAAVEAALVEVMTSAELQRRLRAEPASKPGLVRRAASVLCRGLVSAAKGCWACAAGLVGHCREKATEAVAVVREGRTVLVGRVRRGMTAFARQVWLGWFVAAGLVRRFRKPLLVALAAGTTLGVACYLAGPTVSSLVNGLAGFARRAGRRRAGPTAPACSTVPPCANGASVASRRLRHSLRRRAGWGSRPPRIQVPTATPEAAETLPHLTRPGRWRPVGADTQPGAWPAPFGATRRTAPDRRPHGPDDPARRVPPRRAPPRGLPEAEYQAIRRTLDDPRFQAEPRRAVGEVARRQPALGRVRLVLSR